MKTRNYLSPKTEGRISPLEGRGLFAREPISKGEVILDISIGERKLISRQEADKLYKKGFDYVIQIDNDRFVVTVTNDQDIEQGYLNHSCRPNCGIKNTFQVAAMRDVNPGEELTFDYAMSESSDYAMECKCGNNECRKIITGKDWMISELQIKYMGYFSDYLQKQMGSMRIQY